LIENVFAILIQTGAETSDFSPFLEATFLKTQYAKVMLTTGRGSRAEFEPQISHDAALLQEIFQLSEVSFCEWNPESTFLQPLSLILNVKNTKALTIQLFELNVTDYLSRHFLDIESNISLDGLVPNELLKVTFDNVPSHVRFQHRIEFASLQGFKRGIFVVEVVGPKASSRAVIRKGHLRFTERMTSFGHEFVVFDEHNAIVDDFLVIVPDVKDKSKRQKYISKNGVVCVPFYSPLDGEEFESESSEPVKHTNHPVYIGIRDFGVLGTFTYCEESYALDAKIFIDSEQLVAGTKLML
jgi:hypothetical protein